MSESKKYYWLRLKEGFFDSKHIKFLRSQENGDRMCIVYLQLQLKSLRSVGVIHYDKLLPSCTEEIAFDLGEPVEIVNSDVLTKNNLTYEVVGKSTTTVQYEVKTTNAYRIRSSDFRAYADMTDMWSVTGAIPIKIEVLNHSESTSP